MTTAIFFAYLAGIAGFVGFSAAVFGKRNTVRGEV